MASTAVSRPPDILIRTAPPLSATSDAPLADVPKPPESASNHSDDRENGVPAEMSLQEKADAEAARSTEAGADPEKPAKPAKTAKPDGAAEPAATDDDVDLSDLPPGTPTWAVREIGKARKISRQQISEAAAAAKAATEAATAAQAELAAMRAKLEAAPTESKPTEQAPDLAADPRPTRDGFDDPDAYDQALTEWAEREGVRKVAAKAAADAQAAQAAAQEAENLRLQAAWAAQRTAAIEKYPDYATVAEGDHAVSMPMAQAIMGLDNGADVAYWLGNNPEVSARIAAMPNVAMQLVEVGRLSAQIAAPRQRAARAKPIEPIVSGSSPADTSERELSMEEYAAKRTPEILNGRKPFFNVTERVAARH